MREFFPSAPAQQRGSFAMLAVLLLLIVVALALRYLLLTTQASTYSAMVAHESMRAAALADSGVEVTLARLQAGLNKNNTDDCAVLWLGSGQQAVSPVGSYEISAISLNLSGSVPAQCDPDRNAPVCRITITGSAGDVARTLEATRKLATDVGFCINPQKESGLSGSGGSAIKPISYSITTRSSSVVLLNIAFRRQDPGGNAVGGSCTRTDTGSCQSAWEMESGGGGQGSVGAIAQVATSATGGDFGVSQLLKVSNKNVDRPFAAVGGIFEGSSISYIDQYHGATTLTNSGAKPVGSILSGSTFISNCADADTLVFNISASAATATDGLTRVSIGSGDNAVDMNLLQRYHYPSSSDGLYSEIWYYHQDGGIAQIFTVGADTPFTVVPNHSTNGWQWASGFLCLKGVDPTSIRGVGRGWQPVYWWEPL